MIDRKKRSSGMKLILAVIKVIFFPWFFLRWVWRKKWMLVKTFLFTVIVTGGVLGWLYYYYVIKHPGKEFSRDQIMKVFSVETPVYYDDGKSLIGVFFENEHRIYIKYKEIPKDFVNALIAAEDKNFFIHPGIDPLSILRAAYVNLRAKKIIQGGSTLTQQTAKNLFKRSGRTFPAKFKELIEALKLEAHYSKREIIEFFTNQFFVSGTGRGLAIAAKYFFDKPVDQLNLLECAFIAGSVRAPNRYNPLIQSTPEKQRETLYRAIERKNYVLKNMMKLGMISYPKYLELTRAPIPFKKGKIYYQQNVIMDFIREQLQSEKFQKVFKDHGISNIATSGIKIYTTINRELQVASLRALRKHLCQLETMINGYDREAVQSHYSRVDIPADKELRIGQFVLGRVEKKVVKGKKSSLLVKVGDILGKVDYEGLMNLATPFKKSKAGIWASPTPQDMKDLLSQIEVGDLVYVYLREKSPEDGTFLLDLEQKPKVQGALVVTRKGKILSMVGGFENIYFNRAVDAKRQMGSIFKPLVFTAALQLGWNLLDPLENRRGVFVFQDQFYFPRPDHESPYSKVSLAWAGVKSENVASVWLLYHLCDKLTFSRFKKIAKLVDLAPREDESYYEFKKRMRDVWGIIVTDDSLREVAFQTAKEDLITDLIFAGRTKESETLKSLKYGRGFDEYREGLREEKMSLDLSQINLSLLKEYEIKDRVLKHHFLHFLSLNSRMLEEWGYLRNAFRFSPPDPETISSLLANFCIGIRDGQEVIAYGDDLSEKGFLPLSFIQAYKIFKDKNQAYDFSLISPNDIMIEGQIRSSVLANLSKSMEGGLIELKKHPPYAMLSLWKIRDYRILVGLLYVTKLCKLMGIETPLEPVLSFPLGPNAVSILEISRAYSTFLEGKQYADTDKNKFSPEGSVIIDRIVDAQGEEIYHYLPQDRPVLDPCIPKMIAEILKNVVSYGTGIQAHNAIKLKLDLGVKDKKLIINIPTLGKTGTANEYSNSSYIGFVPSFSKGGTELSINNSFIIAAYAGYDDNAPMKNKHLRIFGASGALPIWIDVANEVVNNRIFQETIDPIDFAFLPETDIPLTSPPGTIAVPVDKGNGLLLSLDAYLKSPQQGVAFNAYGRREGGLFKPQRFFVPFLIDTETPIPNNNRGGKKGEKDAFEP